jgi:hypothetical protein
MLDILDEIIDLPFDIFWDKFLEKGGLNVYRHQCGAIWFSMTRKQREDAFTDVASCEKVKEQFGTYYLKTFL